MRIAIFADCYKPQINGVVTSVVMLSTALRRLGHKVLIIAPNDPDDKTREYGVLHVPSITFPLAHNFRTGTFYAHKLLRGLKRLRVDIIHCHTEFSVGVFAKIAAFILNIPLVHTYHTLYEHYTHYVSKKYFKRQSLDLAVLVSKLYANTCDGLIVPTDKVRKTLESYGIKRHMHVVPTGLEIEDFFREKHTETERLNLRRQYNIAPDDFLCVYVGRISYEKSIDMLIRVFMQSTNPRMKLLVVGEGPETEVLKKMAASDERIIFTGAIPYADVPLYYQAGDVFLNASISETQGLTFIEAMAAGCLLLVRADDSLKDIIVGENAGIVYNTESDLAINLQQLSASRLDHNDMRANAVQAAKRYSVSAYGESAANIYKDTLAKRRVHNRIVRVSIFSVNFIWDILRTRCNKLLLRG
jgi:1,2-diacylglycerol 3-alpha-glucosyltransferase